MKTKFHMDHTKENFKDITRNSPAQHETMLIALMQQVNRLQEDRQKGEKKGEYNMRMGYALGMIGVLSVMLKTDEADILNTTSGTVEKLLAAAVDENAVKAWSKATLETVQRKEMKRTMKPVMIKFSKKGEEPTIESMDDLPLEVREAISRLASKLK